MSQEKINIFWFRRDLRLEDNAGLFTALSSGLKVLPIFIFDTDILDMLPDRMDKRINFIHQALSSLEKKVPGILYFYGKPEAAFDYITSELEIKCVFCNEDYEPDAVERDRKVSLLLENKGVLLRCIKDQVIFSGREILKSDGEPYTVYTPYSKLWISKLKDNYESLLRNFPSKERVDNLTSPALLKKSRFTTDISNSSLKVFNTLPILEEIGFLPAGISFQRAEIEESIIKEYHNTRDFPANESGTTRLSTHLRFGTISIRTLVKTARDINNVWLGELIWREFFKSVIYHFPYAADEPFKRKYGSIKWRDDEEGLNRWCNGETGYPIVDAGMRELNKTGFMHNRARMITASFLTKHLLIDWRIGESYFAEKLLDYDLSSNNGNWQWVAGCGCDAAPYFRIFNPETQTKKFDPEYIYIKKWVPEFDNSSLYPEPIIDHAFAYKRALDVYKAAIREW